MAEETAAPAIIDALSELAWPVLIAAILFLSRSIIADVLHSLSIRIKSGAAIKTPWIEIASVHIEKADISSLHGIRIIEGEDREKDRQRYYNETRRIILVHKIFPSTRPGQLYDTLVYVISHNDDASFKSITKVEYFFGPSWRNKVFISDDPKTNFAVAISSYGSSLCTAKVVFDDTTSVTLYRYLDFEMGPFPTKR